MKIDESVRLNQNLGHQMLDTDNCSWIIQPNKTAISCPPEFSVFPTAADINQVFQRGVRVLSFKTDISEKNFFEYIFEGSSYEMEGFDRKVRNRVKKGLSSCQVRDASLTDLITEGLIINQQTTDRQTREEQMLNDRSLWEKYVTVLYNADDVCIKGAYIDDILVAYAVFIKVEDKYCIYHPYMKREYSAQCPMNAIYYQFFNDILASEGTIKVSAGLSSYIEKKDLDRFKTNMRLEMVPCTRILVIAPPIAPLVNSLGGWVLKQGARMKMVDPELVLQYEILRASKGLYSLYLQEKPR